MLWVKLKPVDQGWVVIMTLVHVAHLELYTVSMAVATRPVSRDGMHCNQRLSGTRALSEVLPQRLGGPRDRTG